MDRPHGEPVAGPAAILWQLEHGVQALPRLGKADVFKRMFDAVSDDPGMEFAMIDATIVKVHRHGQGAKGGLRARPSATLEAA